MEAEGARRCRRGGAWPLAGRLGVWNFRNAGAAEMQCLSELERRFILFFTFDFLKNDFGFF